MISLETHTVTLTLCTVQDMSKGRAYYQLISYGDAVYAMGGHNGSELDSMERWTRGGGWVSVANLPYSNHRSVQSHSCMMMLTNVPQVLRGG